MLIPQTHSAKDHGYTFSHNSGTGFTFDSPLKNGGGLQNTFVGVAKYICGAVFALWICALTQPRCGCARPRLEVLRVAAPCLRCAETGVEVVKNAPAPHLSVLWTQHGRKLYNRVLCSDLNKHLDFEYHRVICSNFDLNKHLALEYHQVLCLNFDLTSILIPNIIKFYV